MESTVGAMCSGIQGPQMPFVGFVYFQYDVMSVRMLLIICSWPGPAALTELTVAASKSQSIYARENDNIKGQITLLLNTTTARPVTLK